MGIPGLLREIGKGERIALAKLAVEHLERTQRPLRIAIDAAVWQFQVQAGQGGTNPALRTIFYRLIKLLALPIQPIFVYDGKRKPLTKRGKTVTGYGSCIQNEISQKLVREFRFAHHTAPGEAEAECAMLQRKGIVDAVMSQDVDAIMFGSAVTLRDWSQEGMRGSKTPTHVNVLRATDIKASTNLNSDGMILVALLNGGDYSPEGIPGFGSSLACEIARAGFGTDLLCAVRNGSDQDMREWRERLQYELETNESGYFRTRHKTLRIPDNFPDRTILGYYTNPAVSSDDELPILEKKWQDVWKQEIDVLALRIYVAEKFEWLYKSGARKFIRCLAPSILSQRLWRGRPNTTLNTAESIKERRQHFMVDGMPELRVEVTPADAVGLDLQADEDDPPNGLDEPAEEHDAYAAEGDIVPATQLKQRKSQPWDPLAPEKLWIPETIVKLGVPALVEAWEEKQREILADPKKFATRKCAKTSTKARVKSKDTDMKPGALDSFFSVSKSSLVNPTKAKCRLPVEQPRKNSAQKSSKPVSRMPTKRREVLVTGSDTSPTIDRYFTALSIYTPPKPASFFVEVDSTSQHNAHQPSACPRTRAANSALVASIFAAAAGTTSPGRATSRQKPKTTTSSLPRDLSTGLTSQFLTGKMSVASRDSLPGTWKELETPPRLLDGNDTRRRRRISCMDMTEND